MKILLSWITVFLLIFYNSVSMDLYSAVVYKPTKALCYRHKHDRDLRRLEASNTWLYIQINETTELKNISWSKYDFSLNFSMSG